MDGMAGRTATTEEAIEDITDAGDMVTGIGDTTDAMETVATEGEAGDGAALNVTTVGKVAAIDHKKNRCQKTLWKSKRYPLTINPSETRECP